MEFGRRGFLLGGVGSAGAMALGGRRPLALEAACPGVAQLPRAGLWGGPPPLTDGTEVAAALGLGALWVVRDDLGGTVFAGGKARKLDLLIGACLQSGKPTVATTGGTGSNHARCTALAAQARGLHCKLALLPQPETAEVKRNLAAIRAAGAEIHVGSAGDAKAAELAADLGAESMWIPMGGSDALGDLAFVDAAFEHAKRATAAPDVVVIAFGSTGSAAGLAIGFALAGVPTRVHAVRCSSPATSSRAVVDGQIAITGGLLRRLHPALPAAIEADARARLTVDGGELGGGYAVPTARGTKAIEALAKLGVPLEPTYGAKAAAAVLTNASQWRGKRVDLWLGSDAKWLAGRAKP